MKVGGKRRRKQAQKVASIGVKTRLRKETKAMKILKIALGKLNSYYEQEYEYLHTIL